MTQTDTISHLFFINQSKEIESAFTDGWLMSVNYILCFTKSGREWTVDTMVSIQVDSASVLNFIFLKRVQSQSVPLLYMHDQISHYIFHFHRIWLSIIRLQAEIVLHCMLFRENHSSHARTRLRCGRKQEQPWPKTSHPHYCLLQHSVSAMILNHALSFKDHK